jgi:hypothetical protein
MRKIPVHLIGYYLLPIQMYFLRHPDEAPPSDRAMASAAKSIKEDAIAHGALDDLRLAIELLVTHGDAYLAEKFDTSLAELIQDEGYKDEETLKETLIRLHALIWPDAVPIPDGGPPDAELVA